MMRMECFEEEMKVRIVREYLRNFMRFSHQIENLILMSLLLSYAADNLL